MRIVVSEYASVRKTFVCHYGGTYLAEPDAVPPTCSADDKPAAIVSIYDEGRTIKMRTR